MTLDERKQALEQQLADAQRQVAAWQQTAERLIGALIVVQEMLVEQTTETQEGGE